MQICKRASLDNLMPKSKKQKKYWEAVKKRSDVESQANIEFIDISDFDESIHKAKTEEEPHSCQECKHLLTCQPINCPFV